MAAKNLAVVNDGEITVYGDPLNPGEPNILARIPLGSRSSFSAYTAALRIAGWRTTKPWGWQETAQGARPAVPAERI